jgi:hypothetical protein
MISVVCWMWNNGFRTFLPEHVNVLQRMVSRHLPREHRFVCVTDETKGFSAGVEVVQTPAPARIAGELKSPEGPRFPSCYRRLWTFSEEARVLGDVVLLIDIDLVVTASLAPLFDFRSDVDFVGWRPFRDWGQACRFGGGIYRLRTGTRTQVWTDFRGQPSIDLARRSGFRGSDQAWISYKLARSDIYFERSSGIYSIRDMKGTENKLPADARLVQFNGPCKPWQSKVAWLSAHWR